MQWINRDSFEDRTILILIPNLFFIFHRFNDYWCGLDCLQNIEHPPRRGEQVYSNHNPGPEEQYTAGGFDTPGARRGRDPSRFNFSQRGYWVPFTLRTHGSYSRDKYLLDISLVFEARICREKERERERERFHRREWTIRFTQRWIVLNYSTRSCSPRAIIARALLTHWKIILTSILYWPFNSGILPFFFSPASVFTRILRLSFYDLYVQYWGGIYI